MAEPAITPSESLRRISAYEATLRRGIVTVFFRMIGKTSFFAWGYRRIGPRIDPWLMRVTKGWLIARVYGIPALLIITKGAKTGLPRTSPLLYVRDGSDFIVVGTNFGQGHHPAWTNNLLANPQATVEVGPARVGVTATLVDDAMFSLQWPRLVELYPGYAGYLERSGRQPRMFRLIPSL
jgi:deazaflavin-dependent oxidoreductase (nitroreductase family)